MSDKLFPSLALFAVFISGLVSFGLGLQRYNAQKETQGIDPDDRTTRFLLYGSVMVPLLGDVIVGLFIPSRLVFLAPLLGGMMVYPVGLWNLRRRLLSEKTYFFSYSITVTALIAIVISFPLLINVQSPITWIYAIFVILSFFVQSYAIEIWRRTPKKPKEDV